MRPCNISLFFFILLSCANLFGQTVTLTANNNYIRVDKVGTVTFSGPGITLEEIAKEENLTHISGRTYRAAIIYDIAFSKGLVNSRGKIFNCTDKEVTVTCDFYNGNSLIATYKIPVKARTFNRMIPDWVSFSSVHNCNRIVCSESWISAGTIHNSIPRSNNSYEQPDKTMSNHNSKSYFNKETYFYGENATNRLGVTYYPNGKCSLNGYILDDECWIRGTSEGRYYIKNGIIYVTWDDWVNESYKLERNQYNNDGLVFKQK